MNVFKNIPIMVIYRLMLWLKLTLFLAAKRTALNQLIMDLSNVLN